MPNHQPPTVEPKNAKDASVSGVHTMPSFNEDDDDRPTINSSEPNEGEGNITAARRYDAAQEKYATSGRVEPAAQEAKRALDGPEGEELRRADTAARATVPAATEIKKSDAE